MPKDIIPIRFCGGMNNAHTPLDLFLRDRGETELLQNADLSTIGEVNLLRPLAAVNETPVPSSIHSGVRVLGFVFIGVGTILYWMDGATPTSIITGLSGNSISFTLVGKTLFLADGTNRKSIYLGESTPLVQGWGQAAPSEVPVVAAGGSGNPDGTYSCYYRYKITLRDGTVIRTELSPVTSITVSTKKLEWSGLVLPDFEGAAAQQIELFRFKSGFAAKYLVTLLEDGVDTYEDNIGDSSLQNNDIFEEDGYYPPPDELDLLVYVDGLDRIFMTKGNTAYWTEPGLYHTLAFDLTVGEYANVNDVFLAGEDITAMVLISEQLYFGSSKKWRRLRGRTPDYWTWEDIGNVLKGPISPRAATVLPSFVLYPASDGHLWRFTGFSAERFLEWFKFPTAPDATCHSTFDGRIYRLYYGDPSTPLLLVDFYGVPEIQPRVMVGTQGGTASFYDPASDQLYVGDSSGYLRNGADTNEEVTLKLKTSEIPIENLAYLGQMARIIARLDSQGANVTVTPYKDGVAQTPLTSFSTDRLKTEIRPIQLSPEYTLSLEINITTNKAVRLQEPWLLRADA